MKTVLPFSIDQPERGGYETVDSFSDKRKDGHLPPVNWQVYVILCSDNSLYTGITTDLTRRLRQHATGQGAKYFRGRCPEKVLYLETGHTRSSASRREAEIKSLTHAGKRLLAGAESNEVVAAEEIPAKLLKMQISEVC